MTKIDTGQMKEELQAYLGDAPVSVSALQEDGQGGIVAILEGDPAKGAVLEPLRQKAEQFLAGRDNVRQVRAILTAERKAAAGAQPKKPSEPHGMAKNPRLDNLPIRKIIAVASGKGGVGKSMVAANLAYSLQKAGYKTGLLDADIYGPSVPKLTGLEDVKPDFTDDQKIIPPIIHQGMQVMSIGFMLQNKEALIWRGPMVQTAIYQMLRDVAWGAAKEPLDILVVDMPPGTGDAQLTLAQKVPVSGAIIVSTPQDIALIDARKAIEMFGKTDVPVLGLIENMSYYECSHCGHREEIFGHGTVRAESEIRGVSYLGAVPLSKEIREKSDAGELFGLDDAIVRAVSGALAL